MGECIFSPALLSNLSALPQALFVVLVVGCLAIAASTGFRAVVPCAIGEGVQISIVDLVYVPACYLVRMRSRWPARMRVRRPMELTCWMAWTLVR